MKLLNWVDILIIILMLWGAYIGFRKGLVFEIFKSTGIVTAIVVSLYNCCRLGRYISDHSFVTLYYASIFSVIVLLIAIVFIFKLIRLVAERLVKIEFRPLLEGFGGLILGLARGGVLASIILVCLAWLPARSIEDAIDQKSYLGPWLVEVSPAIYDGVMRFHPGEGAPMSDQIFEEMASAREAEKRNDLGK